MRSHLVILALLLVGCGSDNAVAPSSPGSGAMLSVGQADLFSNPSSVGATQTLQLSPNATYVIAVVNTSNTESGQADFTLHGQLGAAASAGAEVSGVLGLAAAQPPLGTNRRTETTFLQRHPVVGPDLHLQLLERDRRLYERHLRRQGAAAPSTRDQVAASGTVPTATPISLTVGDINQVSIRDIRVDTDCTQGVTVSARTAYVSNKLVILEDVNSPLAGQEDAFFAKMGGEYDALTYPEVLTNFADPLALLPSYAPTGRVIALFSPVLNEQFSGVAGFVSACDFFPRSEAPIGNQQLIFYDFVADNSGDEAEWQAYIRSVAAHESKHVASYSKHITDGASDFEEIWLEEATAQMSAEIWDRNFTHAQWKGDATFARTVGCDPPLAECGSGYPQDLLQHFAFLYDYLSVFETESPTGQTFEARYGGAWSFVRWVTDQYATSESGFLQSVIGDPVNFGLSNLQAHSGHAPEEVLLDWVLATAADHYTPPFRPSDLALQLPSWDQRDIFLNIHADYLDFPLAYPLQPRTIAAGNFDVLVQGILAGGGSVFVLTTGSGASGPQLLEVRDGSGKTLTSESGFRLGIVRVD